MSSQKSTPNITKDWGIESFPTFKDTKVHVLGGAFYAQVVSLCAQAGMTKANSIEEADLVVFTGGEDVNPLLYGQEPVPETHGWDNDRDAFERLVFEECCTLGIPMFGICRGAQFLHVMNGGQLFQHVDNHANGPHMIVDIDEDARVEATSLHHQMLMANDHMDLLAVCEEPVATRFKNDEATYLQADNEDEIIEVEACYYHTTQCFCVQGHPEIGSPLYRSWTMHKLWDILNEWNETKKDTDECAA